MLRSASVLGEPTAAELLAGVRDRDRGLRVFGIWGQQSHLLAPPPTPPTMPLQPDCCANVWRSAARFCRGTFLSSGELAMTTTEVSDSLERVDGIINMLDEICDHMDGFSSAEEAWLSSITETLRTWRYVMQETYECPEDNKDD